MFRSARIKLTFWYLLIIMIISIAFSSVIYQFLTREVDRFVDMQRSRATRQMGNNQIEFQLGQTAPPVPYIDDEIVVEVKHRLYFSIAMINGGIFIIAGALAYFVAGKTLQPIQAMMDEQHRFISDASHELKTPLTSLKTAFEVFLRSKKTTKKEAEELISESIEEVNKLQRLTESMLQLASSPNSTQKKVVTTFTVSEVISDVIKKLKPMAKQKKITVSYMPQNSVINGNLESIRELVTILLDNAIKYGDEKSTVTIIEAKQKSLVRLSFINQGMGIHPKDLPFIFDRFYRADQARSKTNNDSYGLGLSIAQKIVDDHGGEIKVSSVVDKTTTFIVVLPSSKTAS
jgi:signal transduction histidine kinase